jgi:hypothetical protein
VAQGHALAHAWWVMESRDREQRKATTVLCAGCNCSSGLYWHGWRAYRIEHPDSRETPTLEFYCQTCDRREVEAG